MITVFIGTDNRLSEKSNIVEVPMSSSGQLILP
jgi:hypothetical protein